jgi:hypothetical protein
MKKTINTQDIFSSLIKLEELHLPFQEKHYEADMNNIIKNMIFRKIYRRKIDKEIGLIITACILWVATIF